MSVRLYPNKVRALEAVTLIRNGREGDRFGATGQPGLA